MCAITELESSSSSRRGSLLDRVDGASEAAGHSLSPSSTAQILKPSRDQDLLAKVTYSQKQLLEIATESWLNFYNGRIKFLLGTTQPSHVIAVLLVVLTTSCYIPAAYSTGKASSFTTLIYLASICIHIGDQFWMTFISGLALYFNLPRHTFGEVQKVLFPKYFTLNSFLSALTLITFARLHTTQTYSCMHWIQVANMTLCFLIELLIRVYLVPPVLRLISEKTRIEQSEPGVGQEVGYHDPGRLALCPYYSKLHKTFRKLHLFVAFGNITCMACTTMQLIYLQYNFSCITS